MKRANKSKRKPLSLKLTYFLCSLLIIVSSFMIYYFSFDSRVKVLAATGNYYYTDQQILEMAGLNSKTRMLLAPAFVIEQRLSTDPLIESVSVKKGQESILVNVKEKTIIGYYVKDGHNYMLTNEGESILINEKYLNNIIHIPLLSDFSDEQLKMIWQEFKKYDSLLTREVIEKIAEMVPYSTSYDSNMIKITMQDGNMVYTSVPDLMMMSHYEDMLSQLKGQSVCLVLDATNSSINKLDCAYLNMSLEEREAKRKEEEAAKKAAEEEAKKQAEEEKKRREEEEKAKKEEEEEETDEDEEQEENEEDSSGEEEEENEEQPYEAEDWVLMPDSGYLYSASLNLYQDPETSVYYRWDDSEGFIPFE